MKLKTPKIEDLFDAGVHFGHQIRRWHPRMEPYIYTVQNNIHVINLEETEKKLKEACEFLYEKAKSGDQLIFVGTKRQARDIIELEAKRCGAKHVTDRWLGGTITNFKMIKKNIDNLVDMLKKRETGEYNKYTKKERLMLDREIGDLQRRVGGIVGLRDVPSAVFVIDTKKERTAVREAKSFGIPVIGIVDTNCDPTAIDYPIPANDDAIKSIALIVKTISDAVEQGYKDFDEDKANAEKKEKEVVAEEPELKVILVTSDEEIILDDTAVQTDETLPIIGEVDKKE